ncbi:MAG: DnaA regulatory inactivator Hda, partial [Parahaliea sp.]
GVDVVSAAGGHQLALQVQLRDEATLDNFMATPALAPLLPLLRDQCGTGGEPVLLLHGGRQSGKSHLLQASCHLAGSRSRYLPLAELRDYPPAAVLAEMEAAALVCLDDLQAVTGREDWERELFHFYNRARAAGCRLLLAADAPPAALEFQLADLRSRLGWGIVYHLPAYDDGEKARLLVFRARRRGLQMSPEVARYIVSRAPRDLSALLALLDQLDERSLAEQRALTLPFVRAVLGW